MITIDKKSSLLIVSALIVGLLAGYLFGWSRVTVNQDETPVQVSVSPTGQNQNSLVNQGNCLADECLLVDDLEYPVGVLSQEVQVALDEALNDEYKALATYEAVIDKFGFVRPFAMIKGAEEQHIASLVALYDKYGLTTPDNSWLGKITVPDTLTEACQVGVEAEIANAALYQDELLPVVADYEDISAVFKSLMTASEENHLPAFEKCN